MKTLSITEASRSGISGLVAAAESGEPIALARHGRVVAEVVSADQMATLRQAQESLLDAALVMARFVTDSGERTDLDDALEMFGFSRTELEAELAEEIATGRL
ncbi:type II toxin-antitoxin system Phd/YefM family antitoxin [Corynebacterium aquatimens]|uniref:type II toxin-antitoxin system Phd/YefM family antitoxin n=1 Tax=Corynebacterium TaxID=1716 RepID=UPI001F172E28|nr:MULTISPECIES: type II toxin-antitoxin system Phd/YefM family antitoxin [Corynebacterium]QYH19088.1 type II toxin-antitoxin system Phd/YefM family antitoxin [Corynebacterium aquatimens]UIZ92059.1 type II toxin-antitoxin system Phd/YefM family antitoxin [Corynebacterium sp. CNCTC7651]